MVNDHSAFKGGASQLFLNEVLLLRRKGHKIHTFTLGNKKNDNNFFKVDKDNEIYSEPSNWTFSYFFQEYFNFKLYRAFIHSILIFKPHIIHFHNNVKSTFSFYLAAKKFNIPIIHTMHDINLLCILGGTNRKSGEVCLEGSLWSCYKNRCLPLIPYVEQHVKHPVLWKIRQYFEKTKIDLILCPSLFLQTALKRKGFNNLAQLSNFVHHKITGVMSKKNYILCVSNLTEPKGVIYLVKAFEIVSKKNTKLKLVIIGEGNEKKNIQTYISTKKLTNKVILKSYIPNKKLGSYYKYAKFTIMPSTCVENSPLNIIESFSCGTPVIASNIGGIPELVKDNITGMLLKPRDYIDLSSKILYLLTNPSLLKKMSANCLNIIKSSYDENDHYEKLLFIYRSVLKSRGNCQFLKKLINFPHYKL